MIPHYEHHIYTTEQEWNTNNKIINIKLEYSVTCEPYSRESQSLSLSSSIYLSYFLSLSLSLDHSRWLTRSIYSQSIRKVENCFCAMAQFHRVINLNIVRDIINNLIRFCEICAVWCLLRSFRCIFPWTLIFESFLFAFLMAGWLYTNKTSTAMMRSKHMCEYAL